MQFAVGAFWLANQEEIWIAVGFDSKCAEQHGEKEDKEAQSQVDERCKSPLPLEPPSIRRLAFFALESPLRLRQLVQCDQADVQNCIERKNDVKLDAQLKRVTSVSAHRRDSPSDGCPEKSRRPILFSD